MMPLFSNTIGDEGGVDDEAVDDEVVDEPRAEHWWRRRRRRSSMTQRRSSTTKAESIESLKPNTISDKGGVDDEVPRAEHCRRRRRSRQWSRRQSRFFLQESMKLPLFKESYELDKSRACLSWLLCSKICNRAWRYDFSGPFRHLQPLFSIYSHSYTLGVYSMALSLHRGLNVGALGSMSLRHLAW